MMPKAKVSYRIILPLLGIMILLGLQFILHRAVPFMMDDEWYGTNLVTGQPLQSFADIIESQIWHFHNWGGRSITHGILQLTLMTGELSCDILNVIMTFLLAGMICILAGQKNVLFFLTASSLIIGLNPNIKMSMFWQSGTANYVYSTVWILLFIWAYIRHVKNPEAKSLPLIPLWILPVGLMTGWSNENMGPASFLLSVCVMFYIRKYLNQKIPAWMYGGSAFCLAGCCMVILAPGNFVRTAAIPKSSLTETIYNRILSMLCAGTDYLFPSVLLLAVLMLIYMVLLKENLAAWQWMLLAHTVLSYGAMVLSPHYPDRATFGTMCTCIILILSLMGDIVRKNTAWRKYLTPIVLSFWFYAVYVLLCEIAYC